MAITNIQNGELGSSVRSKLNQAIQEANKVSGKQDSSGLGSAAFESVDAFDPAGSAQAAQDYAVQRSNHTGTQGISTVSGLRDALDRRVIYVDTVADLQALDTSGLVEGQAASVQGSEFRWDGSEWDPVRTVSVKAFGARGNGTDDDIDAIEAAIDTGARVIAFPAGIYRVSRTIEINRSTCILAGETAGESIIKLDSGHSGSIIKFSPADPLENTMLNGQGLQNLSLNGEGNDTGWAIECVKCERFRLRDVRWLNINNGIRIAGGQFNSYKGFVGQSPGSGGDSSGSSGFRVEPATNHAGNQQAFTIEVSDFFITGGSGKNVEDIIDIRNADGLHFSNGYVAFGSRSLVKLDASTDRNISALSFLNVYFDGVLQGPGGSDYGLYIPQSEGTGSISAVFGDGCFFGQYGKKCLEVDSHNLSSLIFNGCQFTRAEQSLGRVRGSSGSASSRVKFNSCDFRNTDGPLVIENHRAVEISTSSFSNISGSGPVVKFSGSVSSLRYSNLSFNNTVTPEIVNDAAVGGSKWEIGTDWHQSGEFAPTLVIGDSSSGIEYDTQQAVFRRMGDLVHVSIVISLSNKGSETGEVRVLGLPFAVSDDLNEPGALALNNVASSRDGIYIWAEFIRTSSSIRFRRISGGTAISGLNGTHLTDTSNIRINGWYRAMLP